MSEARPAYVPGMLQVVDQEHVSASGYAYSPELGEEIARLYGDNDSGGLWGIHWYAPDTIPPPLTVHAWKRQFPSFGLRMREAEKLRAERMMEQTLIIADTIGEHPARSALKISTRQKYAEKLDASRFGNTPGQAPALGALASDPQAVAIELSDEVLAQLALAGQQGST